MFPKPRQSLGLVFPGISIPEISVTFCEASVDNLEENYFIKHDQLEDPVVTCQRKGHHQLEASVEICAHSTTIMSLHVCVRQLAVKFNLKHEQTLLFSMRTSLKWILWCSAQTSYCTFMSEMVKRRLFWLTELWGKKSNG